MQLGLSRAGVRGVSKAIRLRRGPHEKLVSAEISCSVDLDPAQRGVHMSRFPELFEQAIDELVIGEALLVEELAEHIARTVVGRQHALRAEVEVTALYPIERETPVTRMRTQEMVSLIGIAGASAERTRRVIGVEATGINACPCAQGLVRGKAAERLLEAGFQGWTSTASSSSSRSRPTTSAAAAPSTSGRSRRSTPRTSSTSSSAR